MCTLTDELVAAALLAGGGILSDAARYLSQRLGRPVSRAMVEQRVQSSHILQGIRQIAEDQHWARAIEAAKERRQERRSASMKASWAERKAQADKPGGSDTGAHGAPNEIDAVAILDGLNARARARASSALTPAVVQAERDRRLCCARTRKGFPCVRRVVPGKRRCPNHGGLSTGPKTEAGKARIAAAQRARWERFRQERARVQIGILKESVVQ